MRYAANPHFDQNRTYDDVLPIARSVAALEELSAWPDYSPTPLLDLPGLATQLDTTALWLKYEGERFGVKSFKPMGGGYAIAQLLAREVARQTGVQPAGRDLFSQSSREIASGMTVACATEGNHGRAVAWAAKQFGCHAVVYMAHNVTPEREAAIASYGARVVRSDGNHEDAMRDMVAEAVPAGWHVISETKSASDERIAMDTLAGYGALLLETTEQMRDDVPTHLFVQAGVGGLAAAWCAVSRQRWPQKPPRVVVVESKEADCFFRSQLAGERVTVDGKLDTMMLGLAAGEVSDYAWQILREGAAGCLAIADEPAADTMRLLANPLSADPRVAVGESGVAGITAAIEALRDDACREVFGLDQESKILTIATEGVTDPETYRSIVNVV